MRSLVTAAVCLPLFALAACGAVRARCGLVGAESCAARVAPSGEVPSGEFAGGRAGREREAAAGICAGGASEAGWEGGWASVPRRQWAIPGSWGGRGGRGGCGWAMLTGHRRLGCANHCGARLWKPSDSGNRGRLERSCRERGNGHASARRDCDYLGVAVRGAARKREELIMYALDVV